MKHALQPLIAIAVFVGFTAYLAAAAQAQMSCGKRDGMVEQLAEKYGEVRKGAGLADPTAIFEVWASDATGTWTILKTYPNGTACMIAAGEGWQDGGGFIKPIAGKGV